MLEQVGDTNVGDQSVEFHIHLFQHYIFYRSMVSQFVFYAGVSKLPDGSPVVDHIYGLSKRLKSV